MDKSEFVLISEVNGFEIRENNSPMTTEPFRVFHPTFEGVFIADFKSVNDAEEFCNTEDVDIWANELLND